MNDFRPHLARARRLLGRGSYREAHEICIDVLKRRSDQGEAFYLLGLIASEHGNFVKAVELFQTAIDRGHKTGEAEAMAGRALIALNRKDVAVAYADLAIEQNPTDAFTFDTIGVVLSRAGHHARAVEFYEKATSLAPERSSYAYNLGTALQFLGRFSEAKTALRACLGIDPTHGGALVALSTLASREEQVALIPALKAAWGERPSEDADFALQLGHALARCFEALEQPDQTMLWLERGKSEKRRSLEPRAVRDAACFEVACELAEALPIERTANPSGPVFITGMPRTGTTLTDRILSSHPQLTSAGELSDFSVSVKRMANTPGPYVLDAPTLNRALDLDLAVLGQTYLKSVRDALGVSTRFTDKMPLNAFFIPIILAALPQAQVVCLRRHPADTVLSNYRQLFATSYSYYAYAYELTATARYTVSFFEMIDVYRKHLPPSRFRVLEYENLVNDQVDETRRLLNFVGLSFDQACLDFHENTAPVATASATQVRKPIYSSSIGRWRRYRPALDPALDILRGAQLMPVAPDP